MQFSEHVAFNGMTPLAHRLLFHGTTITHLGRSSCTIACPTLAAQCICTT